MTRPKKRPAKPKTGKAAPTAARKKAKARPVTPDKDPRTAGHLEPKQQAETPKKQEPRPEIELHPDKTKKKRGAPSTFTGAIADYLCREIASGRSLRSICKQDDGMPTMTTVMRWLADDGRAAFREQYARAREAQADALAEDLLDIADDGTNDFVERENERGEVKIALDAEHIQRSKLRVDTRKWLMSKLQPKKYGDKATVDLNVSLAQALDSV